MPPRCALALLGAGLIGLAACSSSGGSGNPSATPPHSAVDTFVPPSGSSSSGSSSSGSSSVTGPSSDWTMYHGDPAHSGYARFMPSVTTLRTVAQLKLDDAVYASPIVVDGITIVATENDSVYGFDGSYRQIWKASLGVPSPQSERPCGDITPLGITGTPVYSPVTKLVYVVAQRGEKTDRHELVAFSPLDGRVAWRKNIDLPGADATVMQQRGALAISGSNVFVPFGALAGDCGNYKGRVVYTALDGSGSPEAFDASPRKQGGVWNPAGGTVDAKGNLLFVSANGSAFPGDAYDHTNSVNRISPTGARLDSFAPSDWAENNRGDVGLGSNGVALVGSKYAVLGGKSGPVYVLNQSRLGGIGGQVSTKTVCTVFGGSAVVGDIVYLPCSDTGNQAIRISNSGQIEPLWTAASSIHGTPVVGGGRVWSLDQTGGTLYALSPGTGKSMGSISVGETSRFASPAISGRNVLVPTLAGLTVVRTS